MATLVIRNVEDELHARLKAQAAAHSRSMEEEVRLLLRQAVSPVTTASPPRFGQAMRAIFEPIGGLELPAIDRDPPRDPPDFTGPDGNQWRDRTRHQRHLRIRESPTADPAVVAWADRRSIETLHTTAVSEAEMLYGVAILPPGRRRDDLRRAVSTAFAHLLAGRVLPFDRAAAAVFANWAADRRQAGKPVSMADLQIAAIACARGASAIATSNQRDFAGCGVKLIDPWTAAPHQA